MVIAVDAVGGDHYPSSPVEGAVLAVDKNPELEVILLGPEQLVQDELSKHEYDRNRIHVHHAPQIIGMEESPTKAFKTKQQSSVTLGLQLHHKGECDAFVSNGNTGALLTISTFILGKLEGVIRPTVATLYPTIYGFRLLVDAGANLEVKPEAMEQFALMASMYAQSVMNIEEPKIGLLNVGHEKEKGTEELRETYQMLEKHSNFVGNLEGRDILPGKADVYLCDGVVGNILLKFGESIPENLQKIIGDSLKKQQIDYDKMKMVSQIMKQALAEFNYETVGGLPFLGVNGVSLVGHGGSTPLATKNMIFNASRCVNTELNKKITSTLETAKIS